MAGIPLYSYQIDAINSMKNGCILCGGVGSGKSRTSLGYYYKCNGGKISTRSFKPMPTKKPKDLYIITTARKRDTLEWDEELIPFLMSQNKEDNYYNNIVKIDSWNNIKKYSDVSNAFFIFDEQRVIGSGSWVKAFLKIAKKNDWILLSATPGDSWQDYIPVFLANGFYKNRTQFINEHVIYSRFSKYPKIDRYINTGKLIRYRNSILVNMDFNRKTDSKHIYLNCKYDEKTYKQIGKDRWDIYKDKPIENAAELCYIWRKLVNSDDSRKQKVLDVYKEHPKLIVFYSFDYELEILKNLDYGSGVTIAEWNGHLHEPVPETNRWVYLVQYTAGCEGWNCIKTDTILFYSQHYSYKVMHQASGRIDRLNTPYKTLYYYHLKSSSKIDLAISRALKNKENFNAGNFVKW